MPGIVSHEEGPPEWKPARPVTRFAPSVTDSARSEYPQRRVPRAVQCSQAERV